jgi:hypothetical protein
VSPEIDESTNNLNNKHVKDEQEMTIEIQTEEENLLKENEKFKEFIEELERKKAPKNCKTPNVAKKYLKKLEKWKESIHSEEKMTILANYFTWRNNITMTELADNLIAVYRNKSTEEIKKEFGWNNPFRPNTQKKNEYIRKDKYIINKEDVEKLEKWCKDHPDE